MSSRVKKKKLKAGRTPVQSASGADGGGTPAQHYVRPKDPNFPTRHLFIVGCGPQTGVAVETLQAFFGAYGRVERVWADETRPFVFISYATKDEAMQARTSVEAMQSDTEAGGDTHVMVPYVMCEELSQLGLKPGRKLRFEYAELKQSEKAQAEDVALTQHVEVEGLYVFYDFIDETEEQRLLAAVKDKSWNTLPRRRVQHWGYEFDYKTRNIDITKPLGGLPDFVSEVVKRMNDAAVVEEEDEATGTKVQRRRWPESDQLTVNEYEEGVGIGAHIDTHSAFHDGIISLSLGSSCVMTLSLPDSSQHKSVFLPRRSLLVMTGAARYQWRHAIPFRRYDCVHGQLIKREGKRVSFTFRRVRGHPCDCRFAEECDSQQLSVTNILGSTTASEFEARNVIDVYDSIAPKWHLTRLKPWPKIEAFLSTLPERPKRWAHRHMLAARSDAFDVVLSIAVLHHLSTKERRLQALSELLRITKPGGRVLIYVWALEQEDDSKRKFKEQDVLVPWCIPPTKEDKQAGKGMVVHNRYCHLYMKGELRDLCLQELDARCEVVEDYYEHSNWCLLLRRCER
ncbi:methyltransferase domain containing protein [Acanthamoeba castellanii str. Neff]|uniref:tRNA (carboxymethyluridine(34)-5-O)-methyltransferase n=1 Tax=Acanthamoeba castellanii (strain ATCC 30010 / Neff) TaxID=1257118 RepID=L8H3U3_ACACF|nr:methyltransferase domain containing protein [Acanthamoeba castellanii str. Neff]ELR19408.1 methyltransferase domain containing protein [Acanthamoeba castellanii str. Neff]